ncbi:hypothetical protein [Rhodopila sp.]|uniref:bestrophin-like domain n=1 Tax=Rhodopila sp. TaxID=2480087 RepID=UPI003D0B3276
MMQMSVTMHPIWQTGGVILAAAIVAALLLQIVAHRILPISLRREQTELGAAIFSVVGVTYAVLLAFIATAAWEQYSAAEALARHEAALIGNIYRVSHGLPEPAGTQIRAELTAYLTHIIDVEWPAQIAGEAIPPSEPLLTMLDQAMLRAKPADIEQSNAQTFLIGALSDVATARRDRRLASHGTIPELVWVVLLSGGALMVAFSFILGGPTPAMHLLMTAILVASGVLVLLLIVGLSSPFHGALTIPPDAYTGVLAEIRASP